MGYDPRIASVVGGGIAGCAAALVLARLGHRVALAGLSGRSETTRPVSVPARLLPLLLEFGIAPSRLGNPMPIGRARIAWETANPQPVEIAPKLHLDQAIIEAAFADLAERHPSIDAVEEGYIESGAGRLVDATGRRAAFATALNRPSPHWVTKYWNVKSEPGSDRFGLAALPIGYALRMTGSWGTALALAVPAGKMLGYHDFVRLLVESDAGWLLHGVDSVAGVAGQGGVCSLAWSERWREGAEPVGDALMAGDTLSSQGIAWALSDAMHLHRPFAERLARADERRRSHQRRLAQLAVTNRFASEPAWRDYAAFLIERETLRQEPRCVDA